MLPLQRRMGYRFRRPELLEQALTHSSWAREQAQPGSDNERLEFLGDAVLGLRICERLSAEFPLASEGTLSRLRSWLVSSRNLAEAARRLDFGPHLRLSRAEDRIGGRDKMRLLANAMEATLAAVYFDGGYAAAAQVIDAHVLGASLEQLQPQAMHDFAYKSALQEWAHAATHTTPVYKLITATGPDHSKTFTVEVRVGDLASGRGTAASKKQAEQDAARSALQQLGALPR